jgi:hypothetical protein
MVHLAQLSQRPGYRYAVDTESMRERRQWLADEYVGYNFELSNAWRNRPRDSVATSGRGFSLLRSTHRSE